MLTVATEEIMAEMNLLINLPSAFFSGGKGKGKSIPITGHEGPWGMWMQGSTNSQPRH